MTNYVKPQPPAEHLEGDTEIWPIVLQHVQRMGASREAAKLLHPSLGTRDHTLRMLARDMYRRNLDGIEKHGGPLTVRNGRDPATDAYQEALDGVAYWRQEYERRDTLIKADAYLMYDKALELAIAARHYLWVRDGE